jgi:hypothetical protein
VSENDTGLAGPTVQTRGCALKLSGIWHTHRSITTRRIYLDRVRACSYKHAGTPRHRLALSFCSGHGEPSPGSGAWARRLRGRMSTRALGRSRTRRRDGRRKSDWRRRGERGSPLDRLLSLGSALQGRLAGGIFRPEQRLIG